MTKRNISDLSPPAILKLAVTIVLKHGFCADENNLCDKARVFDKRNRTRLKRQLTFKGKYHKGNSKLNYCGIKYIDGSWYSPSAYENLVLKRCSANNNSVNNSGKPWCGYMSTCKKVTRYNPN